MALKGLGCKSGSAAGIVNRIKAKSVLEPARTHTMSVICRNRKCSCRLGHIHVTVLKNMDELVHLVKLVAALLLLLHHAAHPVAAAHGHTAVQDSQRAPHNFSSLQHRTPQESRLASMRFQVSSAALHASSASLTTSSAVAPVSNDTCLYTVIIETGSKLGAGTDAKVSVKFYNKYGDAVTFLDLGDNDDDNNFERGRTDAFVDLEGACISGICRMWLTHDNTGIFPAWYVQSVKVAQANEMKMFRVMQWVSRHKSSDFASLIISECDNISP